MRLVGRYPPYATPNSGPPSSVLEQLGHLALPNPTQVPYARELKIPNATDHF